MIEALIEQLAPGWALRRAQSRAALRVYSAAQASPRRKIPTDARSGDAVMYQGGQKVRRWARHLDENLDLVAGLLTSLSTQAAAVGVEPQVMTRAGELHEDANGKLAELFEVWSRDPEVTGGYAWGEMLTLAARSWLRDGEVFAHHLERAAGVEYPGLPYSVQLLESEYLPYDTAAPVRQGVELSDQGRPRAYHFRAGHPGDLLGSASYTTQRRTAADVSHLRRTNRLHQVRGVSLLAPIITRLDDLRDYEESERLAARMAAAVCAVITRSPDLVAGTVNATTKERELYLQPGMVFDDMLPGEGVDLLNPTRPNPNAGLWRETQLRAVAAGAEASYSSTARDYSGTYSSQRQELVEQLFLVRRRLQGPLCERLVRPIYSRFARQAVLSGQVVTRGADPATLARARFNAGSIPWIDMLKEVQAEVAAVQAGFKSRHQVIRERGGDPRAVDQARERDPNPGQEPASAQAV